MKMDYPAVNGCGDRPAQRPQSGKSSAGGARIFVTERIRIPLAEITFTFVRSSGPGGQNVNKVNTKAVMRWAFGRSSLPESVRERFRQTFRSRITREGDLVLSSQRYRDQARNREDCIEKLRSLLLSVAHEPKQRRATRPSASSRRR